MSYTTVDALKAYLRIPEDDDTDNTELTASIATAESQINHRCSRHFNPPGMSAVDYYADVWLDRHTGLYQVDVPDFQTTTGLAVHTWDGTDYATEVDLADLTKTPVNAAFDGRPWTGLLFGSGVSPGVTEPWIYTINYPLVKVTAKFGWTAVPTPVATATLMQAARIHKRRSAPFGIVGAPDGSDATRLLDRIDADVVVILRDYIRYWACR